MREELVEMRVLEERKGYVEGGRANSCRPFARLHASVLPDRRIEKHYAAQLRQRQVPPAWRNPPRKIADGRRRARGRGHGAHARKAGQRHESSQHLPAS
jgi:hypothetical protein